jgi:GntR family transcriptional regulator, transcriptional repressor for pyruvate dehydrogenase complex
MVLLADEPDKHGGELRFQELERSARLSDQVADGVLEAITSKGLRPGDPLPSERELAAQFGVSRTVIREAVRSLAGQGIVSVQAGRGLRVAAVGASTVRRTMNLFMLGNDTLDYPRVHEVRTMIEVQIAGLAAERATLDDIAALEDICREMEAGIEDVEAASVTDFEFHRLLAWSTHNELYLVMLDAISEPLMGIRRKQFGPGGRNRLALESHREIVELLATRNSQAARTAMQAHLDDVERTWEREAGPQPASASHPTAFVRTPRGKSTLARQLG